MPVHMLADILRLCMTTSTHHGADIRMRHGIELLVLKLIVGADVNVSAPVLRRVTVSWRREDYTAS